MPMRGTTIMNACSSLSVLGSYGGLIYPCWNINNQIIIVSDAVLVVVLRWSKIIIEWLYRADQKEFYTMVSPTLQAAYATLPLSPLVTFNHGNHRLWGAC